MGTLSVSMEMLVFVLWWTLGVVVPNAEAPQYSQGSTRQQSIPASFHSTMQRFLINRQSFESHVLGTMRGSFDKIVVEVFQYDLFSEFVMTLDRRITTLQNDSRPWHELLAPAPETSPIHKQSTGCRNRQFPPGSYSDMLQKLSTNPTHETGYVISQVVDVIMRQHVDVLKDYRDKYVNRKGNRRKKICQELHKAVERQCERLNCTIPATVVHLLTSDNSDRDKMYNNLVTQAYEVAVSIFVMKKVDDIGKFMSDMAVRNAVNTSDIALAKTYINLVMYDTIEQYKQDKKLFDDVPTLYFMM